MLSLQTINRSNSKVIHSVVVVDRVIFRRWTILGLLLAGGLSIVKLKAIIIQAQLQYYHSLVNCMANRVSWPGVQKGPDSVPQSQESM